MTNLKQQWFEELEKLSVATVAAAKRAASSIDNGIWELPSRRYIALQTGQPVPAGSIRVADRVTPGGRWRSVSIDKYEAARERAAQLADEEYGY